MATAYTYAPDGGRLNPRGSVSIDPEEPLLSCQEQVFEFDVAGAVSADTHTVTLPWNCRVLDAWAVYGSGYSSSVDTIQWGNGTNNITDTINITHASVGGTIDRATVVDPTYSTLRKGDTLVGTLGTVSGTVVGSKAYVRVLVLPTSG